MRAVLENVAHRRENCADYARILERHGFLPESVKTTEDLFKIPPIPTLFFKRRTMLSAGKKLIFTSTTSGTGGKTSRMGMDWPSAWRGLGMVLGTFLTHGLISPRPTNYVMLGYQPITWTGFPPFRRLRGC